MLHLFAELKNDERGVTSIEYGLIVALMSIVIAGISTAFTGSLDAVYQQIVAVTVDVSET